MFPSKPAKTLRTVGGLLAAPAVLTLVAFTACSSEPEVPVTPVPDAGPTTTTTTTTTTTPTGPTAGPCDPVMSLALQTAIKQREKEELAWGMKPEGSSACQVVPEGGEAVTQVMLQQGKCYSILAESFPNVTELDIKVTVDMGDPPPVWLAQFANTPLMVDSDTGPRAAVGRKKECWKHAFPLPIPIAARVRAVARTGSGPVAVQVYSK